MASGNMQRGKASSGAGISYAGPRILTLDAIKEENFRSASGTTLEDDIGWKALRRKALERDSYSCVYCGFQSDKYMEVHHLGGNWSAEDVEDLITVCPLCHSCHHIGFSGIKNRGSLLVMKEPCNQAALNRLILDTVAEYSRRYEDAVKLIRRNLPVEKELGPQGLIMLADMINEKRHRRGDNTVEINNNYIYFPNLQAYQITTYLCS